MAKKDINNTSNLQTGEIIVYNPNDSLHLEVRMEHESVWLSQSQMGTLFGVDRTVIVKHIRNIYDSGELEEEGTCAIIAQVREEGRRSVSRPQKYYNLDMILSVGYRVNSLNATYFRKWASSVLKEYLIRGYAINPRLDQLENRLTETEKKIAFFVKTSLPPVEGIFFDGQIYDAYEFICGLIKSAKTRIILIDNYVDDTVLTMLDKREAGAVGLWRKGTVFEMEGGRYEQENTRYDHHTGHRPDAPRSAEHPHDRPRRPPPRSRRQPQTTAPALPHAAKPHPRPDDPDIVSPLRPPQPLRNQRTTRRKNQRSDIL